MNQGSEANPPPLRRMADARLAVGAAAAAISTLAVVAIVAATGTGEPPLGEFEAVVGLWVAWGDWLHAFGTHSAGAVRLAIGVGGLLAIGLSFRSLEHASTLRAAAALCIGWLAQFDLSDGRAAAATAQYVLAVAIFLWASPPAPQPRPLFGRAEVALAIAAIALFVGLCLHEIHLRPDVYADELAYATAAKMAIGQIPEGPIVNGAYRLERFVAQPIALSIHSAALAVMSGDVLPLRAISIGLGAATLFVFWIGLRGVYGSAAVVVALALAAASPLFLAYSRPGFYIALSVLHATASFVALVRVRTRWNAASAIALGGLMGASIFLYQLSWFVPVFVGLAALAWPELFRRPDWRRIAVIGCATASVVAMPWFALPRAGIQQLRLQTFDKSILSTKKHDFEFIDLLSPPGMDYEAARVRIREFAPTAHLAPLPSQVLTQRNQPLSVLLNRSVDDRAVVGISGEASAVRPVADSLLEESWRPLRESPGPRDLLQRFRRMVSMLFERASWESHGRIIDRAMLNPILAPLLLLGLVSAIRGWRDPMQRLLAIWVVASALLPAQVAGEFPRRAALMEPLQHLLAALVLLSAVPRTGIRARTATLALLVVLLSGSLAIGAHLSARHWVISVRARPQRSLLGTAAVILAETQRTDIVLASRIQPRLRQHLLANTKPNTDLVMYHPIQPLRSGFVLRQTCARDLPLSWVVPEAEDGAALRKILRSNFTIDTLRNGESSIIRVRERLPAGCQQP